MSTKPRKAHPASTTAAGPGENGSPAAAQNILDYFPFLVWFKDREGRFIAVNKEFAQSCGRTLPEDVVGKTDLDVWPRDLAESYRADDEEVMRSGIRKVVDEPVEHKGVRTWMETNKAPLLGLEGQVLGTMGFSRDVTFRIEALEALRTSEAHFKTIFEEGRMGIVLLGRDFSYRKVNKAFCTFVGYTVEELFKVSMAELTHPDDLAETKRLGNALWNGEIPILRVEKRYIHKSGRVVWASVASGIVYDKNGKPDYFLTMVEDITERKRHEDERSLNALRVQAQLKLHQMMDAPLDELTSYALEEAVRITRSTLGYLAFLNKEETVLTMHAWSEEAMLQCNTAERRLEYPVDATGLWGEAVRQRRPIITNDYSAPHPGKRGIPEGHVPILRHMNIPVTVGGRIVLVAGVGNKVDEYTHYDVEQLTLLMEGMWALIERKRVQDELRRLNEELERRVAERTGQLEEANKELEAFAYSVSHDLRAPLRAIDGFTQILLEDHHTQLNEEGKRVCSVVRDETERMGKLIDDLLAFSRLGRASLRYCSVDMNRLVQGVCTELADTPEKQRIRFAVGALPEVPGDPFLLRQVWVNLISNAIKFTSKTPQPCIRIEGREEGEETTFTIEDNGAGFDMRFVGKLFGVFQRLHSMTEFEGTGVGLAIVKRIIVRHNGTVWANGEPGKGATVTFRLPRTSKAGDGAMDA